MKGARKMKGNGNRCRGSLASPVNGKLLHQLCGRTKRDLKKSWKSFSKRSVTDFFVRAASEILNKMGKCT